MLSILYTMQTNWETRVLSKGEGGKWAEAKDYSALLENGPHWGEISQISSTFTQMCNHFVKVERK